MLKRLGSGVGILALAVACTVASPTPTATRPATPASPEEAQEYAVYSALIEAVYLNNKVELIAIDDHTGVDSLDLDSRRERIQQEMPGLTPEIAADFIAQNAYTYPLKSLFTFPCDYVLVSQTEVESIFGGWNDGWEEFYRRYPHAQGRLTLSKVGFSPQRDQALVYAANRVSEALAMGCLFLLAEENGVWILRDTVVLWMA